MVVNFQPINNNVCQVLNFHFSYHIEKLNSFEQIFQVRWCKKFIKKFVFCKNCFYIEQCSNQYFLK